MRTRTQIRIDKLLAEIEEEKHRLVLNLLWAYWYRYSGTRRVEDLIYWNFGAEIACHPKINQLYTEIEQLIHNMPRNEIDSPCWRS